MRSGLRIKADKAKQFRCKDFIIVLENPKNLQNVGSVLRNIDALGAEKLYVVDGYNVLPNDWQTMRGRSKLNDISASAVKWVFVKKFKTTQECISYLDKKDFLSYSTSPHKVGKPSVSLRDGVYTSKRVAVWFGNEAHGLSDETLKYCSCNITIPMCGIIESLNLGTTTGLVIYEVASQRREFEKSWIHNKENWERINALK